MHINEQYRRQAVIKRRILVAAGRVPSTSWEAANLELQSKHTAELGRHMATVEIHQRINSLSQARIADNMLSMRDQFAMSALQGILACLVDHKDSGSVAVRCELAYRYADDMLKARIKS